MPAVNGSDVVAYARTQLGDPYVWGAEGPDKFDCSGLVQYVYQHFGIHTPRTTYQMTASGSPLKRITRADLTAGDLIFSNWGGRRSSHVGIYDGKGNIIEAPAPGQNVKVTRLGPGYWAHVDDMRRVPGTSATAPAGSDGGGNLLEELGSTIGGLIPRPQNLTDAVSNVGTAAGSVAKSLMSVSEVANLITRAALPSNILRGFYGMFGVIFVLIGIWFLAKEVR